ncbi:MAG: ChaN family lipoprotein [Nitrospirae bacterium]|nr:ChaN family lipoprotein [Nitrospirota bacterium]
MNNLSVDFDLEHNTLKGVSTVSLPPDKPVSLSLAGLKIISISINGLAVEVESGISSLTVQPDAPDSVLRIEYEAVFSDLPESDPGRNPGVVRGNFISKNSVVLIGGWYPSVSGLSLHNLSAILPNGFEAISEADEIRIREGAGGSREFSFSFPHPIAGITFVAGKYLKEKDVHKGTEIYTYFHSEDAGLAGTYREYTKKYIDIYEKLLGKYPFRRFSVVENIMPTGYAMPTYTLLGKDVVRLPFIVDTSLGHEIVHQWLGNLIYVDASEGNWSEGLTTYLSDHLYEEMKGRGWDYRKQMLIGYQSYVRPENDLPLKSFTGRIDRATKAVGYGKSALVFHMLKELVGEGYFYDSLRAFIEKFRFRPASWRDIREVFESVSGENLAWFFNQWLGETGGPDLEVKNLNLEYSGAKAVVSFDIFQKGKNFRFRLPVVMKIRGGEVRKTFEIEKETTNIVMETDGSPLDLIIDDRYDIFRRLSQREFPPVVSRLLGDNRKILVSPKTKETEYAPVKDYLKKEGFEEKKEEEVTYDDIKTSSLVILGADTDLAKRLYGKTEKQENDFYFLLKENPYGGQGVIAIVEGTERADMSRYIQKVPHYGRYSNLSFKDGTNTLKAISDTERGIKLKISGDVPALEIQRVTTLHDVIDKARNSKLVYVGEAHDRFEHHRAQLEIIRELHRNNEKVAIGMEMFQRPFQKVVDDYVAGTIDEKEFLKKTEYFKRWVFDYTLYREILLYARTHKIPVIALNLRKEIITKVAKEGLYALSEDEKKEIPEDMDLSDMGYRERLRGFFGRHRNSDERNFDFFYQAQVLWDETMAHSLDAFLKENPGYQVVVLAGVGHLAFGSGIPKRAHRLNRQDYTIILNGEDVEKNIGDFVLFPEALKYPETPKLMVQLKEEAGKVSISEFGKGSISEQAGLRKGDIFVDIDGTRIEGIDDLKIFLLYKKKGDVITVRVQRDRFLFGPTEMEFKVTL